MKQRLDQLLVEKNLAPTREKAQAIIIAGLVLVNDEPRDKPGEKIDENAEIRLRGELSRFVGRGGEKIDPIFDYFSIDLGGVTAIDIGASTGGFTDAMLQRGAERVYAIDVGYNQLDHKLRTDPRVVVMEKTHANQLTKEMFPVPPTFGTIDVSFIGVRKILPFVSAIMAESFALLILVKPQFELEREHVSKGGVVRDPMLHEMAVDAVAAACRELGMSVEGRTKAAITGGKSGNQEYFVFARSP